METRFTAEQLADPRIAEANDILRKCVHCGFCTATCPTYVTLGDELDSPRGRIYLIRDMLESGGPVKGAVVRHIDRCLSCLSCMTTCPSGVDYMHLVDLARSRIETGYKRPFGDRVMRAMLARIVPYPSRFDAMMGLGSITRVFRRLFSLVPGARRLVPMFDLLPRRSPPAASFARHGHFPGEGERPGRVVLLAGCAQPALAPQINDATIRVLNRMGFSVDIPERQECCGALAHHLGRVDEAKQAAGRNIEVWSRALKAGRIDALITNTSGCGTMLRDYGHLMNDQPDFADRAVRFAALASDITTFLQTHRKRLGKLKAPRRLRVAYQSACSLQHGQQIDHQPLALLRGARFDAHPLREAHLCCGSAGTYNLLQPEIAGRLRDRKIANIEALSPDVIATGNVGCMTQISAATAIPVVHTVELLDWASGGPCPPLITERT